MRIAMVPLDSRPPNWQFPQRLAEIAGVELVLPPREWLGTLHKGANGLKLAGWLAKEAKKSDAAIFSWDALCYGGLVQSRDPDGMVHQPVEVAVKLGNVDWEKTAGYSFLTVPRLGTTAADTETLRHHQLTREYFILWGEHPSPLRNREIDKLEQQLGPPFIAKLWDWRKRNKSVATSAIETSGELGLKHCHIAVEDNARTGPHISELEDLRKIRLELLKSGSKTKVTDFDGADECGCLLLAKAICDLRTAPPLSVRLSVFPGAPSIDEYYGRFESRSLGEGVAFLSKLLSIEYHSENADVEWLICRGKHPQPDLFEVSDQSQFNNDYLLPERMSGGKPLFVSDLQFVNGANPKLAVRLTKLGGERLKFIAGFNTNFNTLGLTAAVLRLAGMEHDTSALARFSVERIADDAFYQPIARGELLNMGKSANWDPLDFSEAKPDPADQLETRVLATWVELFDRYKPALRAVTGGSETGAALGFSFPWDRLFEVEVELKDKPGDQPGQQFIHEHPFDVVVAGGGMAGCSAALSAAREGARVCLVEAAPYLGGNATRAMVAPWQSFHASTDTGNNQLPPQVIGGIAEEFVQDLKATGASPGHLVDPVGFAGSITPVDAEALKQYLPQKLSDAGVDLQLATGLSDSHLESAPQIVDATGDVAAARMLGAEFINPTNPQPWSWLFTMVNVDIDQVREYQLAHPEEFVLHPRFADLDPGYIAVSGFFSMVKQAREAGELTLPRDRLLFFSTPRKGEVLVNTTRIPADHSAPRIEGLRQIRELADWIPGMVPGFGDAYLGKTADDIGQRESFRLKGDATLSVEDIKSGRSFTDAVARGCYPIDIHAASSDELETTPLNKRGYYDIPLGCMVTSSIPRLVCAGRCISADREGFASARVLPTAMATGQAAGYIAARRALKKEIEFSACLSLVSLV